MAPYEEITLARAMERLVSDPELRDGLSEGGKLLLKEEFSWGPIVEKLESLYEEVVAGAHGGRGSGLENRGEP